MEIVPTRHHIMQPLCHYHKRTVRYHPVAKPNLYSPFISYLTLFRKHIQIKFEIHVGTATMVEMFHSNN